MDGLIRLVRWVAVVVALTGGLALASSRALAEGERPGNAEPLPATVVVWDCPYEGADLGTECETVPGVPVDVVADGVPVEGSGALTTELYQGLYAVSVLLPPIGAEVTASAPGVTATILTPDLELFTCENGVTCAVIDLVRVYDNPFPDDTTFLVVVDANCPVADADVSDSCTRVEGSVVHVAVDGEEIAGSPTATEVNGLGFYSADFFVPTGATLTVWAEPNGDGYVPAAGYDPLTIGPESFYVGGCGGEARCPYVFLINVPAGGEAGESVQEPVVENPDTAEPAQHVDDLTGVTGAEAGPAGGEVVTRLPDTGAGPVLRDGGLRPGVMAAMLAWPLVAGLAVLGVAGARRRTNAPR